MNNNDQLQILMKKMSLRASWIAEACGCSTNTVYSWRSKTENGDYKRSMPDDAYQKLCSVLVNKKLFGSVLAVRRWANTSAKRK